MNPCQICEKRRPERHCPALRDDICARCCGEEREHSIECPLECPHLQEAHRYEKLPEIDPSRVPYRDIRITDEFLDQNEAFIAYVMRHLLAAALETPGVVDTDVREALESMIRTQLTLESGLIYETRPTNPYAAAIQQRLRAEIERFRRLVAERSGVHSVRDKDVLGVLVFLQRLEYRHNNGRRRGRAFLGFLRSCISEAGLSQQQSLIVP